VSVVRRMNLSLCLTLGVIGVTLQAASFADSVPFWGAKASVPIDTPINQLRKGDFLWMGEAVTAGPWSWSSVSLNSAPIFIETVS